MPLNSKHPRVEPLEPPYDEETAAALDMLGPPIQLFRVFARRPDLARGISGWGSYYLSRRAAMTLRHREIVILRTTALCGADYEWGIHVATFAAKADLDAAQLRSLGAGTENDPCWGEPSDAAVVAAVDALHHNNELDDATWARLVDAVGTDAALEITLLAGWYHAISYAVRTLRLPLEPGTEAIPR
ncbi:MAG: carboxymuconolactone decarboxylase family protein [Nocardioides sp.]|uniref:carboxymuconolactone decarboxylase family protein n=1 Tax=Nocardioides sp. TaxID=35761 RepID=UPI003D6BA127